MWIYVGIEYVELIIKVVDLFYLLLINILILLCLGVVVIWVYYVLVYENNCKDLIVGLLIGIVFGVVFIGLQVFEYYELIVYYGWLLLGDVFYNIFFMVIGFYGFYVVIGIIFFVVCLVCVIKGYFIFELYVGFEVVVWYWYFVDVVWLFFFVVVYIWG